MIELIEHLPPADARRLLAEARGMLSPQGRLVVTTPNYRSLWPLIEWGLNRVSRVSYEQQRIRTNTGEGGSPPTSPRPATPRSTSPRPSASRLLPPGSASVRRVGSMPSSAASAISAAATS